MYRSNIQSETKVPFFSDTTVIFGENGVEVWFVVKRGNKKMLPQLWYGNTHDNGRCVRFQNSIEFPIRFFTLTCQLVL